MQMEYIQNIQNRVHTNEIIKQLRSALVSEFLAVHSYWVQSKLIQGVYRDEILKILLEHREEEQGHANMLMDRILQLGGNPEIRPMDWDKFTKCRYANNISWDQKHIIENAIDGERCSTESYSSIAEFSRIKDQTTYDIIMKILEDEYQHIRELNKLKDMMLSNGREK